MNLPILSDIGSNLEAIRLLAGWVIDPLVFPSQAIVADCLLKECPQMVFKTGFLVRVAALFIVAILPACRTEFASTTVRPTAIPAQSSATTASATATPIPPSALAQYLEFSNPDELEKAASFPLWLPTPPPAELPFYKAWIAPPCCG